MKLKTLKDLPKRMIYEGSVSIDELKAEAIKWRKQEGLSICSVDWDEFFNITEEDLK